MESHHSENAGAQSSNNARPGTVHYIHLADALVQNDLHLSRKHELGAIWSSVFFSRILRPEDRSTNFQIKGRSALPTDLQPP